MSDMIPQPYFSQLIQRTYGGEVGNAVRPVVVSGVFAGSQERLNEPADLVDSFRSVENILEKTSRSPLLSQSLQEPKILSADGFSVKAGFSAYSDSPVSRKLSRPHNFSALPRESLSTETSDFVEGDNSDTSEFFEFVVSAEPVGSSQTVLSADAFGLFSTGEPGEPAVLSQSEIPDHRLAESTEEPSPISASPRVQNPIMPLPEQVTAEQTAVNQIFSEQKGAEQMITSQLAPTKSMSEQVIPNQAANTQLTRGRLIPSQINHDQTFDQQTVDIRPNVIKTKDLLRSEASENDAATAIEPLQPSPFSEGIKSLQSSGSPQQKIYENVNAKPSSRNRLEEEQSITRQSNAISNNLDRKQSITPALITAQTTARPLEQPISAVTSLIQRSHSTLQTAASNPNRNKTSASAVINKITNDIQPVIQPLVPSENPIKVFAQAASQSPQALDQEKITVSRNSSATVTVTIGRIEIRASQPPPPQTTKSKQQRPKLSLAQYLQQRDDNS